jgi:L-threonylcarbamoyladenylate synthase
MSTRLPTQETLELAADIIRRGGVVVMPTETVYGIACNALDASAVRRIFEIKGRPSENPLIVHLAGVEQLKSVASHIPPEALKLAERFWPGPLTMVLPKNPKVPDETTGGLETVAVRVPGHGVARELIRLAGVPVAAPSANLFMGLSPTTAEAIDPAIQVDVDMIIDGGPCEVGLESTVVDMTGDHPRILRPGGVTRAQIQAVLGRPLGELPPPGVKRAPGMYPRHYAPKAKVVLVDAVAPDAAGLVFDDPANGQQFKMPMDAPAYGTLLYAVMRRLDLMNVPEIQVATPPSGSEWEAVNDRLRKAAG